MQQDGREHFEKERELARQKWVVDIARERESERAEKVGVQGGKERESERGRLRDIQRALKPFFQRLQFPKGLKLGKGFAFLRLKSNML